MLPFFSPLAEETLERPLPMERRFNASFLNSSVSRGNDWSILYQRKGDSMLPFLTPLAEDTLEHPLPKEKRFTASLAVETLEHPLPKERSCNVSFLFSFSRGNTGASFTKGMEIQCFLS